MSKLTPWEVGQDLIYCYDEICDRIHKVKESGYTEQYKALNEARNIISKCFNREHMESHSFGLGVHDE